MLLILWLAEVLCPRLQSLLDSPAQVQLYDTRCEPLNSGWEVRTRGCHAKEQTYIHIRGVEMPRPWASQGSCKLQLEVFDERESWGIMKTGIMDSTCHIQSTCHLSKCWALIWTELPQQYLSWGSWKISWGDSSVRKLPAPGWLQFTPEKGQGYSSLLPQPCRDTLENTWDLLA